MARKNRLDKSFGPSGSTAGFVIMFAGILTSVISPFTIIVALVGAFMAFSTTSAHIDFENRKIRFSNDIFGIIPTGEWEQLDNSMLLGIRKSKKVWRSYSMSNKSMDVSYKDYRIILYDHTDREIMPVAKFKTLEQAETAIEKLVADLQLTRRSTG